jgi:hypothetical protein
LRVPPFRQINFRLGRLASHMSNHDVHLSLRQGHPATAQQTRCLHHRAQIIRPLFIVRIGSRMIWLV